MSQSTVVFITGVSKGIGRGLVEAYLARPNHLVIGSLRDLAASTAELESLQTASGSKVLLVQIENTSVKDPKQALDVVRAAGIEHIDIFIANAGGTPPVVSLEGVHPRDLLTAFHTNAASALLLFQTFRPLLQAAPSPKWASISSNSASLALMGEMSSFIVPAYGVSKIALNWLTHALHHSQDFLIALTLHPGHVQTVPGNWIARQVGMEKAPTTVADSAASIIRVIDQATRETSSGKFIDVLQAGQRDPVVEATVDAV
ncbi:NAD(P)-binding protein [Aspergillus brunneoviolaceus CBS 621.78]|uniref:NAD(P)-binding protein n=1 Tax=Aspergillus brunneoviolaceus CBS 621.78 TaxID=1450534 RepID=A0ACD1FZB9_9EURO|nr:NAD(P)-binding protein [Aspergillus brunneoviolaceus CBS 621.78]RAH42319.1 NAD(P)-binding protein [Aspergillus brunneoviolaceus CBS 621.78]